MRILSKNSKDRLWDYMARFQAVPSLPVINSLSDNNKTSRKNIKIKKIQNGVLEATIMDGSSESDRIVDHNDSRNNICIINVPFPNNYGHCLHDVIPQLLYLDQQSKYDKIYTSGADVLHSLLEMIQVKFKKIHFIGQEEELVMNCTGVEIQNWPAYHKRDVNKTRLIKQAIDKFIKNNIKAEINNRLIYCTRNTSSDVKHGRMMNHENEIVELLKKYCDENNLLFTMFDGQENGKTMSHIKQLELFNEARVVVGPHGSAMANVIYLNPENNPKICEFCSGTEVQVHGSKFDKHYNFLFGYLFEEIYDYNLIPFDKSSTPEFTSIDVGNLQKFIKKRMI
jgi:hypothetical protein